MTASMTRPSTVAPVFSPGFVINPEPTLAWLRENDPLHHEPRSGLVILTRHEDCAAALSHPSLSAEQGQADRTEASGAPRTMLNTDGPEHDRLRRPAQALLGPAATRALAPALQTAARRIVDRLATLEDIDVARDIAEPLATATFAALLCLGEDREPALRDQAEAVSVALDPVPDPVTAQRAQEAVAAFNEWLDEVLPHAAEGSGLRALVEEGSLDTEEVKGIISLAVVGGWSPLVELLTTAIELVLPRADLRDVAADAERSGALMDDIVRWHTPIPFVARESLADVELPSGTVPAGRTVLVMIGSAGRDSERWDDASSVRADRSTPRAHLAFGGGVHFCMGAALIREVLPTALATLLEVHPDCRLTSSLFAWRPGIFPRRPMSARLVLDGWAERQR